MYCKYQCIDVLLLPKYRLCKVAYWLTNAQKHAEITSYGRRADYQHAHGKLGAGSDHPSKSKQEGICFLPLSRLKLNSMTAEQIARNRLKTTIRRFQHLGVVKQGKINEEISILNRTDG